METALEVSHVSKSFPGVRALDDVSFGVRAGSVHALMGENGAGKSTLLKILAGQDRPDVGEVRLHAGSRVALLRQQPHFEPNRTLFAEAKSALDTETPSSIRISIAKNNLINMKTLRKTMATPTTSARNATGPPPPSAPGIATDITGPKANTRLSATPQRRRRIPCRTVANASGGGRSARISGSSRRRPGSSGSGGVQPAARDRRPPHEPHSSLVTSCGNNLPPQ